jgi:predicted nucleotidyltransferase
MDKKIEQIIKNFSNETQTLPKDNLVAEYLFGSVARAEGTEYSDIDILIIVRNFNYQIRKQLSGISSEYSLNHGVYISPVIKDLKIWEKNRLHHTAFYEEIRRDGVQLC